MLQTLNDKVKQNSAKIMQPDLMTDLLEMLIQ